jgi:hypothetical protein
LAIGDVTLNQCFEQRLCAIIELHGLILSGVDA